MSTLFTTLHGDRVLSPVGSKIIPAADFATLQRAEQVLQFIQEDAERYRIEVAKECEEIKEQAYRCGYEDGFKDWADHLLQFEKKLEHLREEMQQAIIPIALKAAKKIVGREVELSDEVIVDIVASNLKPISQHKKITIFVNKKELDILEKHKGRLREIIENLESLSIRPREDIEPGGCMIETEIGIINAQMQHRWDVLEKAFESLLQVPHETQNPS